MDGLMGDGLSSFLRGASADIIRFMLDLGERGDCGYSSITHLFGESAFMSDTQQHEPAFNFLKLFCRVEREVRHRFVLLGGFTSRQGCDRGASLKV